MKIKLIKDINEFQNLKADWDRLFVVEDCSVFQSFEFNYFSWITELSKHTNNQLAISVVEKKDEIISIFPFYIDAKKQLRFINDIHADSCDFITKESVDFLQVYLCLKNIITFKSIHLINVTEEGNIYKALCDADLQHKIISKITEYSFLNINEGDFPYNVPHYRSYQKHRINKAFKRYQTKQHRILSIEDSSFPLEDLDLLKQCMINLGMRNKHFITKERFKLIEELYNSGLIILSVIRNEDQLDAVNIILKQSPSKFLFWIDLFNDSRMINVANYINFLKEISSKTKIEINFGRGAYPYKTISFNPEIKQLFAGFIFETKMQLLLFQISYKIKKIVKIIYKKIRK